MGNNEPDQVAVNDAPAQRKEVVGDVEPDSSRSSSAEDLHEKEGEAVPYEAYHWKRNPLTGEGMEGENITRRQKKGRKGSPKWEW